MAENRDDVIKVGKKPLLNYATVVMSRLNEGGKAEIRARGRTISAAVDISQMVINKFVKTAKVDKINIGTETLTSERGNQLVSYISISMSV